MREWTRPAAATITALIAALAGGCTGSAAPSPLDGVSEIVFLQRQVRAATGDVYQQTDYLPPARLVSLRPPTADGTLTVLCCEGKGPDFATIDIMGYDLSFDAREVVFSGRLSADQRWGLFVLSLEDRSIDQLPTDPNRDYLSPIFVAGDRIVFVTNAASDGERAHRDESDRAIATQLGVIERDGSGERIGPRTLSHRISPTALADGRILFGQWDHLGPADAGDLLLANPDLGGVREGFGKEGKGLADSYLAPVEIAPGRILAVATSRVGTLQSGALVEIRLGELYQEENAVRADRDMAEATSSIEVITSDVPLVRKTSFATIGRYHDGYPIGAGAAPALLVSWADGPVFSEILEEGGVPADFGVYLYDQERVERRPIWDDPAYWELHPRPLAIRPAPAERPPTPRNPENDRTTLIGSVDVYQSTRVDLEPGTVYGVQVVEGFGVEEGIPANFGTTGYSGAARLGVAPIHDDGSWLALVPADAPVQLQPIDRFGMALATEPVWISGGAGQSSFCGGCHEDRAAGATFDPTTTAAYAVGPVDLLSEVPRQDRHSFNFNRDSVVGVPWAVALQPIFDAKCVSCHHGNAGAANPTLTITTGAGTQSLVFDLRDQEVTGPLISGYSASYLSLFGIPLEELDEGVTVSGNWERPLLPQDARNSPMIQLLNPVQQYPTIDAAVHAFSTTPHGTTMGFTLTPEEHLLFILAADLGGQFYSRENAPGGT